MAKNAWLTPDTIPAGFIARRLVIPDDFGFVAAVNGALLPLADAENWEAYGDVSPDGAAQVMETMVLDYFQSGYSYLLGIPFPILTAVPPPHSLELNGQTIVDARTKYRALWDVIDDIHKSGDDIILPDWRGKFIVGAGDEYEPGDTGGDDSVTLSVEQIPAHSHSYYPPIANVDVEPPVGIPDLAAGVSTSTSETGLTGGGAAHENRPPFYAVRWAVWVD